MKKKTTLKTNKPDPLFHLSRQFFLAPAPWRQIEISRQKLVGDSHIIYAGIFTSPLRVTQYLCSTRRTDETVILSAMSSSSPPARYATGTQAIPARRTPDYPDGYSSTPGGTLYSTTPGGKCENFLHVRIFDLEPFATAKLHFFQNCDLEWFFLSLICNLSSVSLLLSINKPVNSMVSFKISFQAQKSFTTVTTS